MADRNYTCVLCDKRQRSSKVIIRYITFVYENQLYNHVPVHTCINPVCLKERGANIIQHRSVSKPPTENQIRAH